MTFSRLVFTIIPALFVVIFMATAPVSAQDAADNAQPPVDILPAATAQEQGMEFDADAHTHPALKLTPDKSELLRLDQPAGSIIIGNPNHISILADTADTLVLVPRAPGATHFIVLGKDGTVLMQRHVIVASPQQKYVRVRRSCAGSDDDACQSTSVFYCPDMCHEIILGGIESSDDAAAAAEAASGSGNSSSDAVAPPAVPADSE